MAKGMSIHIGLNQVDAAQYQGWDGQLRACEQDARDMALIAEQNGFRSETLLTAEATVANVTGALAEAARSLESGDMLFLTYSGHGGQVPDTNGDEADDAQDETWVLYDRQVVDDELYSLYAKFQAGVRILVLSDSCHSGSVYRALPDLLQPAVLQARYGSAEPEAIAQRSRAMPIEAQEADYRDRQSVYDGIQKSIPPNVETELAASLILISGCKDNQLSGDGPHNGVFTARLLDVWNNGKFEGTYQGFHRAILKGMPADQSPELTATGAGSRAVVRQHPFTI